MPDHYFSKAPHAAHREIAFPHTDRGRTLFFQTDAGVFSKAHMDKGTLLLLEALPDTDGRVLDMGCGWGAIGVCMAARCPGAQLVLADINARAVDLARANLSRNGLSGEAVQSDGFDKVTGSFSLIACNPPIRAGKAVVYGLLEEAKARLLPGGALFVVIRKQQGAPSALAFLQSVYAQAEVVLRGGGFWVIRAGDGA